MDDFLLDVNGPLPIEPPSRSLFLPVDHSRCFGMGRLMPSQMVGSVTRQAAHHLGSRRKKIYQLDLQMRGLDCRVEPNET
jgi:hypothetical protein